MVGNTQNNANVCTNMERSSILIEKIQIKTIVNYHFLTFYFKWLITASAGKIVGTSSYMWLME